MIFFIEKSGLMLVFLFAYYRYAKTFILKISPRFVSVSKLERFFPYAEVVGVIELILIASSHVLFAILLITIFHIPWHLLGIGFFSPYFILYGLLLGIGAMGVSTLIARVAMECLQIIFPTKMPANFRSWVTTARGGWMRHHLHSLEVLPLYASLLILCMQVGSEEIVFRGVLLNYFSSFGSITAITASVFLFVFMQALYMTSWISAMFPMIGALVMGIVHGFLYIKVPLLWPLIIAHVTFFIFAVI